MQKTGFRRQIFGRFKRSFARFSVGCLLYMGSLNVALAQISLGNIEGVLEDIVDILTGNVAKLLSIIAICLAGLATLFNQINLRTFGMIVLGIAIIFGSAEIVETLTA